MSLINRVLNQLEQRGADTSPGQTQVRAVPIQVEPRWKIPALFALVIIVSAMAAWLWPKAQVPQIEPVKVAAELAPVPPSSVSGIQPEDSLQSATKLSFELGWIPQQQSSGERSPNKSSKPVSVKAPVAAKPPLAVAAALKPAQTKQPAVNVQSSGTLPLKQISHTQRADAEYRKALALQQQGHVAEALAGYDAALQLNAQHDAARLAQAALLIKSKRSDDAERLLQEGLKLNPTQTEFSMVLARVQVERGKVEQALDTLQQNLPQAADKAEYQAFYAALLQRESRHEEAVKHYQIAVQLSPNSGVWLMGYGISLQAIKRIEDAKAAYQRALATQTLSPELTAFIQQKLKGF